jgi:hypothetical protein
MLRLWFFFFFDGVVGESESGESARRSCDILHLWICTSGSRMHSLEVVAMYITLHGPGDK